MRRTQIVGGIIFAAASVVAACGSRTGLFGDDIASAVPGGSSVDGASDARPDGAVRCTPGRFTFELATAQLMLVVDRSGSMAFSLDGRRPDRNGNLPSGVLSRWETLRGALAQTIVPFDNVLAIGAKFFPEAIASPPDTPLPADEACRTDVGVGIAPARGNASTILDTFDTTRPIGGTPTSEAIRLAAAHLAASRSAARTMVVATDGAPNCNPELDNSVCVCTSVTGNCTTTPGGEYNCLDDTRTISVVRDISENQNIPVYVIGIGSTERPEFLRVLDEMAIAGGRPRPTSPRHYNVQSADELRAALQTIGDSIAKCTYLTPSAPSDPNAISVEIRGAFIPRDATHQNGWDWIDREFGTLAFFGPACVAASSGAPSVTGVVTCGSP